MKLHTGPILKHEDARGLIRRAVAKAEDLAAAGAFVVVNEGGVPISASRMDGAGVFGIPVSRAKAYVAGAGRETSTSFAARQSSMFLGIFLSYQKLARDNVFPGQGAFLIRRDGAVVGAMSTGAGIGPFIKWPGLSDPSKLLVDGQPTNLEDLVISYALGEPYQPQHGDDMKRWVDVYGAPPSGTGSGFAEAPPARKQATLAAATALADAALGEAARQGTAIAVVVVDRNGDVVQLDRMDGAPPMSADTAEAVAVTALNFQSSTDTVASHYRDMPQLAHLIDAAPFKFLPVGGGMPIKDRAAVVGAIGVASADPTMCTQIAKAALAAA